jgi:hypothetical protein
MNLQLTSVSAAFVKVPVRPKRVAIDRKGIVLPRGGHFQGIPRIATTPERLVITSSSDTEAYFLICDIDANGASGRANPPVRLSTSPLNHAGGC